MSITIGESPSFSIFEIKEDRCFMAVTGLIFFKEVLIKGKRSRNAEIKNWKFGLHAFVLLMNTFNFGPSSSTFVPQRFETGSV